MTFKVRLFSLLLSGLILTISHSPSQAKSTRQPLKIKSSGGIDLVIPPQAYSRADLMKTSAKPDSKLYKVLKNLGWIQSSSLATLENLPQGKYLYLYAKIIGFNAEKTQIKIAYQHHYEHDTNQVIVSTWDIKNKNLQQLLVLAPNTELIDVSPDQNQIAVLLSGEAAFFDARTGKRQNTTIKNVKGLNIQRVLNSQSYSPDSQYISLYSLDFVRNSDDTVDRLLSNVSIMVFRTGTGQRVREFSESYEQYKRAELIFAPDSSKFLIKWKKHGLERPDYSFGNMTTAGYIPLDFKRSYEFSADSKYLASRMKLYDIEKESMVEGYEGCEEKTALGIPVPNGTLNVLIRDGKFRYQTIVDQRCLNVQERNYLNSIQNLSDEKIVFSNDLQTVATLTEGPDKQWRLDVLPSEIPSEETIAKFIAKKQKSEKITQRIRDAEKMYKAGFAEEAMSAMRDLIEENANDPMASKLAMNYIISWAKELPLVDVGKAFLRQSELIFNQPRTGTDGLSITDEVLETGFAIERVFPQTSAQKSGLKKGDIILKADGNILENEAAYNQYIKNLKPGDTIELSVMRNGQRLLIPLRLMDKVKGAVWGLFYLSYYGTIASAAGHPDLTLAAARKMKKLSLQYSASANTTAVDNFIVALESLSMAKQGDSMGAYKYAIKKGGFVKEFDVFVAFHVADQWAALFIKPLFENRKKLAYLLDLTEDELPASPTYVFPKQPYIDLEGNIVGQNVELTKNKPESKAKPKIQVLED